MAYDILGNKEKKNVYDYMVRELGSSKSS